MSKETGGPAFPTGTCEYDGSGNVLPYQDNGMTLRDYFAAKAMQSYLVGNDRDHFTYAQWAVEAYQMADAMLAARDA